MIHGPKKVKNKQRHLHFTNSNKLLRRNTDWFRDTFTSSLKKKEGTQTIKKRTNMSGKARKVDKNKSRATTAVTQVKQAFKLPEFQESTSIRTSAGASPSSRSSSSSSTSSSCAGAHEDRTSSVHVHGSPRKRTVEDSLISYKSTLCCHSFFSVDDEDSDELENRSTIVQGILIPIEALSKSSIPSDKEAAMRLLDTMRLQFPFLEDVLITRDDANMYKKCFVRTADISDEDIHPKLAEVGEATRATVAGNALLLVKLYMYYLCLEK